MDVTELEYRPLSGSDADLALYRDCFQANGSRRSVEIVEWQFIAPPPDKIYIDVAVAMDDREYLAAVYAVFPIIMKIGGERRVGVQSMDTLTDSRFRGKGLFVKLAEQLYQRCASEGVALVYGFPNGNSVKGFFKNLNWNSLDPVPQIFRPMRMGYLLRKARVPGALSRILDFPLTLGGRSRLREGEFFKSVTTFDDTFTQLWDRFARRINVGVVRDASYLQWRLRKPKETYETIALYSKDGLRGFVVIGMNDPVTSRVGKVMELIYDDGDERAGTLLLKEGMRVLYERGAEVAWACNFEHSHNHTIFKRCRFFTAPARFRPVEGHIGVRSFDSRLTSVVNDRRNWYISLLDSDTH